MAKTKKKPAQYAQINVRVSAAELRRLDRRVTKLGLDNRSQYLRMLLRKDWA